MRCKICSKVNKHTVGKRKCWKEYNMCGDCARILHEDDYPKNHLSYVENKIVTGRIKLNILPKQD